METSCTIFFRAREDATFTPDVDCRWSSEGLSDLAEEINFVIQS
jgi:hypothetical protein